MHADETIDTLRRRHHLGNDQRRRVAREDGAGFHDLVDGRVRLAFDFKILRDRFDDDVAVRQVLKLCGALQPAECLVARVRRNGALLDKFTQ